jgi:hypothetical protein
MTWLGNGLSSARLHTDALSVKEAQFSMMKRLGAPEHYLLVTQSNLANTYAELGRHEDSLRMSRDVYSGNLRLEGAEAEETLRAANNYAWGLFNLRHFDEAKALMRKMMPVARRVFGESDALALKMRWIYAAALYLDTSATLGDLRESVEILESVANSWKRIFGPAHPETPKAQDALKYAREALAARLAASSAGSAS